MNGCGARYFFTKPPTVERLLSKGRDDSGSVFHRRQPNASHRAKDTPSYVRPRATATCTSSLTLRWAANGAAPPLVTDETKPRRLSAPSQC